MVRANMTRFAQEVRAAFILQTVQARWLTRWYGQPWIQRRFFHKEQTLFAQFLTATNIAIERPSEALQTCLLGNRWGLRWQQALSRCPLPQFAQLVKVHGLDRLQRVYQQKRGVILVHHYAVFTPLVWTWLSRYGFENKATIGRIRRVLRTQDGRPTELTRTLLKSRQLHMARQTLLQGGLVRILPDGAGGQQGLLLPFYNRQILFRTGFAELALHTGAVVMPVKASLVINQGFTIEFCEPLDSGTPAMSHTERTALLVQQYAAFLAQQWHSEPWNLRWRVMERHLNLPAAVEAIRRT